MFLSPAKQRLSPLIVDQRLTSGDRLLERRDSGEKLFDELLRRAIRRRVVGREDDRFAAQTVLLDSQTAGNRDVPRINIRPENTQPIFGMIEPRAYRRVILRTENIAQAQ